MARYIRDDALCVMRGLSSLEFLDRLLGDVKIGFSEMWSRRMTVLCSDVIFLFWRCANSRSRKKSSAKLLCVVIRVMEYYYIMVKSWF